ncbi:MAG: hypothetical protein P8P74_01455 [Crocinitomicaceae bacterium]|nr:hypothetical protein [Crocinitomicaceae bacterium]
MRTLLFIAFASLLGNVHASEIEELVIGCALASDSVDAQLEENQAKYTFKFTSIDGSKSRMLYSIDGIEDKAKLVNNSFEIVTSPGKHIFQFYYSRDFIEVYTDSLQIENRHHSTYEVYMFRTLDMQITVDKPVIYLYPEKETEVELSLNIIGSPLLLYPEYDGQWQFAASPSGDLTFGDKTYNYLFWEATQSGTFSEEELKTGFNVKKENAVAFLEEKLTLAGLNSKEQADFITYWGPRLAANELNFIRFEFNEVCNRYAELDITPKPDHVYRIYMTWIPIESELNVIPQTIETMNREGFCVLEWGGSEVNQIPQNSLILN